MFRSFLIGGKLIAIVLCLHALRADEAKGPEENETLSLPTVIADSRISKALKRPIPVDFKATPLQDVLAQINAVTGVQIYTDLNELHIAGTDPDQPITIDLKEVTLGQMLDLILNPLDLTYIIKDNHIIIASTDMSECIDMTRVYPVADLLSAPCWKDRVGLFVKTYCDLIGESTPIYGDKLPLSLSDEGAITFSPTGVCFVITAPHKAHRRIEKLFEDLRSAETFTNKWLKSEGFDPQQWKREIIESYNGGAPLKDRPEPRQSQTRPTPSVLPTPSS